MRNKLFIILPAIAIFAFGSFSIHRAEAQLGDLVGNLVGSVLGGDSGAQTVRIISDASESAVTTAIKSTLTALTGQQTSDFIEQLLFKEQVLDPAAWGMAKQMQQQLTGELLKWLGGQQPGQGGEIPFIQDYGEYYQDIVDSVVGEYIFTDRAGDATGQCDPEKSHKVSTALKDAYQTVKEKAQGGGALQCENPSAPNKYTNAFHRLYADFLECRDEACGVFVGQDEINKRISTALWIEEQVTRDSRGFKPQKVCTQLTNPDGTTTEKCKLVNPPSLAADMVSFNLVEMPGLQMLNMDEFNEIASNLMNNLANQALQGLTGVLGLSGNAEFSVNVFGAEGNLSYVDALIQDDVTAYQTSISNPIGDSLLIEQKYLALQTYILDEIGKLEDKLASNTEQSPNCFDLELTNELKKIKEDSTTNSSIASTTLSILDVLNQQYLNATDAATRNSALTTYNTYKNQGFLHTNFQLQEIQITFIDLDFAKLVERFKYDTAVERQQCGGSFDYDGILSS